MYRSASRLPLLVLLPLVALLAPAAWPGPAHAATFTVNSTADGADATPGNGVCETATGNGACTLRAAIQEANALAGPDTIGFNISGGGVQTIRPASALPRITSPVVIDGYTQQGARANSRAVGSDAVLLIELDGSSVGVGPGGTDGLMIGTGASTVQGLVINRFRGFGVSIRGGGATGNLVEGNYIGTDASGTAALGDAAGVEIRGAPTNTVGGTGGGAANRIAFNGAGGVAVQGGVGSRILGNAIFSNAGLGVDLAPTA